MIHNCFTADQSGSLHNAMDLVDNTTMFRINIHEMKTNLSKHLDDLSPGDRLLVCRRNVAIAEVRRLPEHSSEPRQLGLARGEFAVPATFFEPLPDDLITGFDR